ncbi:MAG: sulfite exporter TauE/SafE family protein [Xanthobacteraceae bacterium]
MQSLVSSDVLYSLSGLLVGVLVGLTGVGGGSLMTPLLILLFGVHPTTAIGTDLLFAASTKTTGTFVHAVARTIDWRLVGLLAIGSIPATIATIFILSYFDLKSDAAEHVIAVILGIVLLTTSLFLITGRQIRDRFSDTLMALDRHSTATLTIVLGLTMGVLVTATSVGAGAIGVTVLLILHPKMSAGRVVGSDIAHAVPLTLLAGAGHWYLGSIDWDLLGHLLIGSLPGIVLGSYLATRARDIVVRVTLAGVLLVVGVRLIG